MAIWRRLFRHATRLPFSRALASAGGSNAARMAMMAMTTRSSIKVNATVFAAQDPRPLPTPIWIMLIIPYSFPQVTLEEWVMITSLFKLHLLPRIASKSMLPVGLDYG